MFTVLGPPQRLCEGLSRRAFLRLGAIGGIGLTLPSGLRAGTTASPAHGSFGRAKRCLLLFLTGGPPQLDTFDLKPDAPERVRGEFRPIANRTSGLLISELFPGLAERSDAFCVVRSVTHDDSVHVSASHAMLTGAPYIGGSLLAGSAKQPAPTPHDHPHVGSLLARVRPSRAGGPTFVALPEIIKDAGVNTFIGQGGGFLGKVYDPLRIDGSGDSGEFRVPDIELPRDVTADRLGDRRVLLDRLDRAARNAELRGDPGFDALRHKAFEFVLAPRTRRAFRIEDESAQHREAYGRHLFGQGCLLARRLLETDVSLVTVYWHYEGPDDSPVWDTHWNNFQHLRERLAPPADRAISTLLDDLSARGLLDETLVVVMGEFGRSPQINRKAGREHWPQAQSVLLAGAGIPGGSVHGSTDREGGYPASDPVTPADLAATILHLLGVPLDIELRDVTGRPFRLSSGTPIAPLLS